MKLTEEIRAHRGYRVTSLSVVTVLSILLITPYPVDADGQYFLAIVPLLAIVIAIIGMIDLLVNDPNHDRYREM